MAEMTTATATMNPVDVDEIERGIAPPGGRRWGIRDESTGPAATFTP